MSAVVPRATAPKSSGFHRLPTALTVSAALAGSAIPEHRREGDVDRKYDQDDRRHEEKDEQARLLAGDILILKIVHAGSASISPLYLTVATSITDWEPVPPMRQNDTLGASRSLGDSISKSCAGANPARFAIIDAGNTSRCVLYVITASLNAWRANATLFSVDVSSS